ncbi:hypothetical protein U9M48_029807 [Paspalum notatum var. saurae]|uniref:Uncharacterized protein n=1 Tax=Paspalum notatum var. saurae TaxID=547442 RepID=A0AAQ3TZL6_PASNO
MADNGHRDLAPTWATRAGFGFLTFNSALAIYKAWGDAVSIVFVSGSYLALLLLFRCLRDYEQARPGSPARRAAWLLTTLLTMAFAWKVAAAMPSAVAAAVVWALAVATTAGGFFVFRCLRDYEQAPPGSPARERASRAAWPLTRLLTAVLPSRMDRKVAALMMAALGVQTCDTALAIYNNDDDLGGLASTTFVLVAYAALLALIILFLREFA